LAPQREPHWVKIAKGCYVGYRKGAKDGAIGGTWCARYRDLTGQQRFLAIGPADDVLDADGVNALSFEQAQEKSRAWFLVAATGAEAPGKPYTVANAMADYLAYVKQHKKSHRHLDTYIAAYILPKLGRIELSKLTTPMIRRWHEEIAAEPPRLRTKKGKKQQYRQEDPNPAEAQRKRRLRANRHLTTLKAALNRSWRDGYVANNGAWARVALFSGVERQRTRILDRESARRLLNTCEPDLRDLVRLALLTGARYGELCQMDIRDFHIDSGTLHVRDSKSGKPRHVVLNDEGVIFCKRLSLGKAPDAPLLAKADGTRWGRDLHQRPFRAAVQRAELEPGFTFHELRHTWASLTIMAGAPLMVVAQNLGHRDTRMVELHYGHLAPSFVTDIIRSKAPSFGLDDNPKVVAIHS